MIYPFRLIVYVLMVVAAPDDHGVRKVSLLAYSSADACLRRQAEELNSPGVDAKCSRLLTETD